MMQNNQPGPGEEEIPPDLIEHFEGLRAVYGGVAGLEHAHPVAEFEHLTRGAHLFVTALVENDWDRFVEVAGEYRDVCRVCFLDIAYGLADAWFIHGIGWQQARDTEIAMRLEQEEPYCWSFPTAEMEIEARSNGSKAPRYPLLAL